MSRFPPKKIQNQVYHKEGKKVLLIDADPQGDLTTCLGYYDQDNLQHTIGTLMADTMYDNELKVEESILHHSEGVDLIPANLDLSAIEFSLVNAMSREFTIKNCIADIKNKYDYVLIDCMPSLGMITINALACSNKVIVPVQAEYLAAKGMGQLLKTIKRVQKQINPNVPEFRVGDTVTVGCKIKDFRNGKEVNRIQNFTGKQVVYETRFSKEGDLCKEYLLDEVRFNTSTILFRRSVIEELNGFDESFVRHQDYELMVRFFMNNLILCSGLDFLSEYDTTQIRTYNHNPRKDFAVKEKFLSTFHDFFEKKYAFFALLCFSNHSKSIAKGKNHLLKALILR